jgi:hypothetical protein
MHAFMLSVAQLIAALVIVGTFAGVGYLIVCSFKYICNPHPTRRHSDRRDRS